MYNLRDTETTENVNLRALNSSKKGADTLSKFLDFQQTKIDRKIKSIKNVEK